MSSFFTPGATVAPRPCFDQTTMAIHRRTRRRLERENDARFVTFSCWQRLTLFDNDLIKDAFVELLEAKRLALHVRLHGYVVMPEHVHLLLTPPLPDTSLSEILRQIKGAFAHRVLGRWRDLKAPILGRLRDSGGREHFWPKGGGYDRNVCTPEEFDEKLDYIHANPVRRGLVDHPCNWAWSSATAYQGDSVVPAAVVEPRR